MADSNHTDGRSTDSEHSGGFEMLTEPVGQATHEHTVGPDVFLEALRAYVEYVTRGCTTSFDDFLVNYTSVGETVVRVELDDDTDSSEFLDEFLAVDIPENATGPQFELVDTSRTGYSRKLDVDEEFLDDETACLPDELNVEVNDRITPLGIGGETARYKRVE